MDGYREVIAEVASDATTLDHWASYARRYPYVGDMALGVACETVIEIMDCVGWGR